MRFSSFAFIAFMAVVSVVVGTICVSWQTSARARWYQMKALERQQQQTAELQAADRVGASQDHRLIGQPGYYVQSTNRHR